MKTAIITLGLLAAAIAAEAQTFTVLKNFGGGSDGKIPVANLTLSGSVLYGTMISVGGIYGTIFKVNTDGTGYTVLKTCTYYEKHPFASLTLSDGVLYGTTTTIPDDLPANPDAGTVFKVNTDGTGYTVLKNFGGSDAATLRAGVTLSGNVLYGTMEPSANGIGGTVFKLNTDGTGYAVLKNAIGSPCGNLTLSGSVLYGMTRNGGSFGTIFKVNTDGTGYTVLKNFSALSNNDTNDDGAYPEAGLTLFGSTLYGTTTYGGSSGKGTLFKVNTDGTGFTNLHSFTAISDPYSGINSDGANPQAGLTLSGNALYGTTTYGGSFGNGTLFNVNTDGTGFTNLHSFTACSGSSPYTNSDGATPRAGLALSGNLLYGTTSRGGSAGVGTLFSLALTGTLNPNYNQVFGQMLSDSNMLLSFAGIAGTNYALDHSFSLSPANWIPQATNLADANGALIFTNTPNPATNNFWRIRSVP